MMNMIYISQVKSIQRIVNDPFPPSELVLNNDGNAYHLNLSPDQIAETIILVGDPGRVEKISARFDSIDHKVQNREFVTHTGRIGSKNITALATGIGIDNIDIVINELDALANIDLDSRFPKKEQSSLKLIRLGTSGSLQEEFEAGSAIHSNYAIGLDGLMHYYKLEFEDDERELQKKFSDSIWKINGIDPYAVRGSSFMHAAFSSFTHQAITLTANGFYGPQGRELRLSSANDMNNRLQGFRFRNLPIGNYEMETSALYGLGGALGHHCTTLCLVIANRLRNQFLEDYSGAMDKLIERLLASIEADKQHSAHKIKKGPYPVNVLEVF